jgi:molybdopterin converting factor small subunit
VTIKVRLYGVLRIGRFSEDVREVPSGMTARELAEQLQLPDRLVGTVLIRDVHASLDDPLTDGDEVTFLAALTGG